MDATTTNNKVFFLINISVYAGSNERRPHWTAPALKEMGVKENDMASLKAILNAEIVDKAALRPFGKLRKRVQEYLSSRGERHPLVGWLINPQERGEVLAKLEEIRAEYEDEKRKFLASYEQACLLQKEKVRQAALDRGMDPDPLVEAVESKQPPISYYERKMEFSFFDSKLVIDHDQWESEVKQIESDIRSRTIWHITEKAEEIGMQERISARAKNLYRLGDKLRSMSFYLPGLAGQGLQLQQAVSSLIGGVRPSKDYSQVEALTSIKLARLLKDKAPDIVDGSLSVADLAQSAVADARAIIEADQPDQADQLTISETVEPVQTATTPERNEEAAAEAADAADAAEAEAEDASSSRPAFQPGAFNF